MYLLEHLRTHTQTLTSSLLSVSIFIGLPFHPPTPLLLLFLLYVMVVCSCLSFLDALLYDLSMKARRCIIYPVASEASEREEMSSRVEVISSEGEGNGNGIGNRRHQSLAKSDTCPSSLLLCPLSKAVDQGLPSKDHCHCLPNLYLHFQDCHLDPELIEPIKKIS